MTEQAEIFFWLIGFGLLAVAISAIVLFFYLAWENTKRRRSWRGYARERK